ncbi:MAG TPA: MCE family protein [Acidimicrobiales bacterium]|nr:MCE family protein [Acidimicrobiales bacterium]
MRLNRRIVVNVAVFAVAFFVMIGWAVNQVVSVDRLDQPYAVSAEFENAFGIVPNAEVTYLGIGFGSVREIERIPGGVRVLMNIERDRKIPEMATAQVSRKSAIGEPYVAFSPPAGYQGGGPFLTAGDVVPIERTSVPLEFSELLRSAGTLVESVEPDDVATLLEEAAAALEGNSQALRDLAEAGDQLAATFAARTEALDRLATNNTRLTRVVTDRRGTLGSSISDLRLVAQSLRASSGDTQVLLDRGAQLLTQTADLVSAQKGTIDCVLKGLELVVDETTTDRRLAELDALLTIGPKAFEGVWQSRDVEADGPWLRVGTIMNRENPPTVYVPPRQLPEPRVVQRCRSSLQPVSTTGMRASTSGDYRPRTTSTVGAASGSNAPQLPATGAGVATGAVLLVVGSVIARRLRSAA